MPAITDTTVIRSQHQSIGNVFVNIPPLTVFATATVNGTPTYPTAEVTVDGASGDWLDVRPQQVVRITNPGGVEAFFGCIRKALDDVTKVYIANIREGDTGTAATIAIPIEDNAAVVVYSEIVPYAYFSKVDLLDTTILYKREDVPWDDVAAPNTSRLTEEPQPIVNMGDHRHIRINPGDTAAWSMSGAASLSWFGNDVNYLWFPPTGVSLVLPSVDTDATVDLEADHGIYIVRLRGEDDGTTKRDNSYRYVFVTDGVNTRAFSEDYAVTAMTENHNRVGRSVTLTVKASRGTDVLSRLWKSAPVLITYEHEYSDDQWKTIEDHPDGVIENFFGYVRSYDLIGTTPDGVDTYTVLVESPLQYFSSLPVAAQTILADAAPDDWKEVASALCHVSFFAYYILQFHAGALLSLSDFYPGDLDDFSRPALSSGASDMLSAVKQAVALVTGANIGCTSNGAVYLRRHGSYETDVWRDALPTVWTWTADDIIGSLEYDRNPIMETSETEGSGTVSGTTLPVTAYTARQGLFAGMQAIGVTPMDGFIGASTSDIGLRVGHHHQLINSPVKSISFEVRQGHDFTDPALMEWHVLNLAAYDPANSALLDETRWLPLSVNRQWTVTPLGLRKRVTLTLQPETKGTEAPERSVDVIGSPFEPGTPGCGACGSPTLTTYAATLADSYWSSAQFTYGGSTPARKATTNITFTLPVADCFSQVILPFASQSGWNWGSATLTIDGVSYGAPDSGDPSPGQSDCDDVSPAPMTWNLPSPVLGRVLFFEGTGISGTGSLSATGAVFCVKLGLCE